MLKRKSYTGKSQYSRDLAKRAKLGGVSKRSLMKVSRGPNVSLAALSRAARADAKGMDTVLDLTPVIATTNTNASSFVLNLIQQGSGSWNRVGRKVKLASARLTGIIKMSNIPDGTTGEVRGNTVRMVLVWDKQPSGAAIPNFNDIFGKTIQDGTESTIFLDAIRYDNMERFTVLRDCVVQLNPSAVQSVGTTALVESFAKFDEYVKLNGRETVFSGQNAPMTIADISTGGLYVFFRSETNDAANVVSIESSNARVRYTD